MINMRQAMQTKSTMMAGLPITNPRIALVQRPLPTPLKATMLQPGEKLPGLTYKQAGVDIAAGDELVERIKKMNKKGDIGGFGGKVPFGDSFLVAGTDGVGTKLKLAFELNRHSTVGIDLVAMSVNDIITLGAKPMFFLDYFATGALDVDTAEQVIKGIVEGCEQSDCILLGGETAEMPGFYQKGEYDLAGFAVGSVKKERLIDGKANIAIGDVILGFPSSGIHSNGFSLVRKVLEVSSTSLSAAVPWVHPSVTSSDGSSTSAATFGDVLLAPTTIYVRSVMSLHDQLNLKGVVHITGGGMTENIPRVIPAGMGVNIHPAAYKLPDIFSWIQATGNVPTEDMYRTFNMGVGLIVVVSPEQAADVQRIAPESFVLGEVTAGEGVTYV